MNLEISLHPLDPLSSPCRRTERIREVLRLASNLAIAELHDADRLLLEQRLVCLDGLTIALQHTIQVRHHVFTIVPGASMSVKRSLVSELSTSVVF